MKYSQRLKEDALLYRNLRDGDTDDPDLEQYWLSLRHLRFNAGYALLTQNFLTISFADAEHGLARYLLTLFDEKLAATSEVTVVGAERVHVEHIYPQQPPLEDRWQDHSVYLRRLTLLDRRLYTQIKNSRFLVKKEKAYKDSRLEITKALLKHDDWSTEHIKERQNELLLLAETMWPQELINI